VRGARGDGNRAGIDVGDVMNFWPHVLPVQATCAHLLDCNGITSNAPSTML
jgi:hypothetical protein